MHLFDKLKPAWEDVTHELDDAHHGATSHCRDNRQGSQSLWSTALTKNETTLTELIKTDLIKNMGATAYAERCVTIGDLKSVCNLQFLLDQGLKIDNLESVLFKAAKSAQPQSIEILEVLLANGADFSIRSSRNGSGLLHVANAKNIRWLVAHGCDINAQCKLGQTPLFVASYEAALNGVHQARACVTELLACGAAPDIRTYKSFTPLLHILWNCGANNEIKQQNTLLVAELLIKGGASVLSRIYNGGNSLIASLSANCEITEFLLDRGAQFDAGSGQMEWATANAVREDRPALLQRLMEHGLDLDRARLPETQGPLIYECLFRDSPKAFGFLLESNPVFLQRMRATGEMDASTQAGVNMRLNAPKCHAIFQIFQARDAAREALHEIGAKTSP